MAKQAQGIDDESDERVPKVKAISTANGIEIITYFSDDKLNNSEEEERHPLDDYFMWKEKKDLPENWEVLAWYDYTDGNKSYVLGSDGRWYWECDGSFMLLLDEELEEFNHWCFSDPTAHLILNGEVEVEEDMGLQNACGLETIQEEDEEAGEDIDEVLEVNEVNTNDRNTLATIWGLDAIIEEVEEVFKEIEEAEETEGHDDEESVWGLGDFENVNEDDENYKLFL